MIKLFIGGKGSGKTKTLIELTNAATEASNGSVVCIEKGDKLRHEITYKARLIDTDEYGIKNGQGCPQTSRHLRRSRWLWWGHG